MSDEYVVEEEVELKGGHVTHDPRLDRVPEFDEASRDYPILATIDNKTPRSYTWRVGAYNDQGREGACVGFAWSHELNARPVVVPTDNAYATRIYKRAQQIDEWPGEAYSGTSVLAGAKAVRELVAQDGKALMPEFRWAFGVDDLLVAVGRKGPAVIGINWYQGMFRPDDKGFIHPTGRVMGGHAIVVHGVRLVKINKAEPFSLENIDRDKSFFKLHNSWGQGWGRNGECYLTVNAMNKLLSERGDACIPVLRKAKK